MEVTISTTSGKWSAIGRFPWIKALLGVAIVAAVVILGRQAGAFIPQFAAKIDSLGGLGVVAFIAGYVLATVAFIPGSLLTLAAGAVFGIVQGTLYVFLAATMGASLAFLLSARWFILSVIKPIRVFRLRRRSIHQSGVGQIWQSNQDGNFVTVVLNAVRGLI